VRVTVLGRSPAWQDAGGACSGYLVQEEGFTLLVDCGNGVFGKLREVVDFVDVDAVVLTHMHADHFLDLVPFAYALTYAPKQQPVPVHTWPGTDSPARPRLLVPPGGLDVLAAVTGGWGAPTLVHDAFGHEEYDPAAKLELGPLRLRFCAVPHYLPTYAIDVCSESSGRVTFGADCKPNDELVAFARDTDVLVVEATLPRPERTGIRGHLTPGEAGDHARRAGAGRCVLTHVSDDLGREWIVGEAEATFGGPVDLAVEGLVLEV
jgi:ribonuclease BN (tRNA processing enzyme)